MVNKSKTKGKGFEREICIFFEKFFELSFTRVPCSGALIGGSNAYRINNISESQMLLARGDIIPPDELSKLVIECKSRKEIPFHMFMKEGGNKEFNEWVDQTLVDFNLTDAKLFFVIFKANNKGKYIAFLEESGLKSVENWVNYKYKEMNFIITELSNNFLEINRNLIFKLCSPNNVN